ncbi:hypothetical protein KIPB_004951 [Kipferlia bialata]|uniref:Uncharacterized protein n=1 Tax=Kipferlia bialata TaxID=797122 RepID=A0A9K3CW92_9EUKA|nr:hypothetical protein KIPB_004951 [Kipferlia bialata]|eukprot:g4951.t1
MNYQDFGKSAVPEGVLAQRLREAAREGEQALPSHPAKDAQATAETDAASGIGAVGVEAPLDTKKKQIKRAPKKKRSKDDYPDAEMGSLCAGHR